MFFGVGGGETLSKKIGSGPNMEDPPNLYFMFFDRYEIQIQACVLFSNGKCSIFQSSSPQKKMEKINNSLKIQNYVSKKWWVYLSKKNDFFQIF